MFSYVLVYTHPKVLMPHVHVHVPCAMPILEPNLTSTATCTCMSHGVIFNLLDPSEALFLMAAVFDVTRDTTLSDLEDYWLQEVQLYSDGADAIKMVVANKVDLVGAIGLQMHYIQWHTSLHAVHEPICQTESKRHQSCHIQAGTSAWRDALNTI